MNLTIYAEFLSKRLKGSWNTFFFYQFIFILSSTYNVIYIIIDLFLLAFSVPLMPFCIKSIDHLDFTVPLRLHQFLQFSLNKLFFWTVEEAFIQLCQGLSFQKINENTF